MGRIFLTLTKYSLAGSIVGLINRQSLVIFFNYSLYQFIILASIKYYTCFCDPVVGPESLTLFLSTLEVKGFFFRPFLLTMGILSPLVLITMLLIPDYLVVAVQ